MSLISFINLRRCLRFNHKLLTQSLSKNSRIIESSVAPISQQGVSYVHNQQTNYCTKSEPVKPEDNRKKPQRSMPPLMKFSEIIWPSFINSFRNWILVHFIIRPYFDNEFNLKDFIHGAKQAVQVISSTLANSNFPELKNFVAPEVVEELKPVIEKMSVFQRNQLQVNKEDIYLSFPYQVGIMFDDSSEAKQKRFVEITMVFHVLKGFRDIQSHGEVLPWNVGEAPEYGDKVFICNYRFIKEFTTGSETDWTVNVVNHFKPADLLIGDD